MWNLTDDDDDDMFDMVREAKSYFCQLDAYNIYRVNPCNVFKEAEQSDVTPASNQQRTIS